MDYVPPRLEWHRRSPRELDLDPDVLGEAVGYHLAHETPWPRDFRTPSGRYVGVADEPAGADDVLGPVRPRGGPNGLVVRAGHIAAEWGDTRRADMSFSLAKGYLSALAGLAVMRGLIPSVDSPVRSVLADDEGFASPQNREITWRHLLEQTSEWQGMLWGKSDAIDHNRDVGKSELGGGGKGTPRPLGRPGTVWEYNDVRVNRLSLSLVRLFRAPLADVLKEGVMGPLGASGSWQWVPYRNSWVTVDGRRLPVVPGGSHWGGGLWMSSRDHARFGLLIQRGGRWGRQQLLAADWIAELARPCPLNPQYGLLWWLNTERRLFPDAPQSALAARGAGSNLLLVDPEHELVVVVRWIDRSAVEGFVKRVLASVIR